jgi:hypothetical protein
MPWYTVLFIVLDTIFSLLALILITKVSLIIKYCDNFAIYLQILFIKIRLNKSKRKKHKIKSLKKSLNAKKHKVITSNTQNKQSVTTDIIQNQNIEHNQNQTNTQSTSKSRFEKIKQKIKALSDTHKKNTDKLNYVYELIKVFLPDFSKYLKVKIKRLEITASRQDAKDTALEYALFCTTLSQIFALADEFDVFKINNKKTYIYCDYSGQGEKFVINASLSLYVWQILICTLKPLFRHIQLQGKEEQ